MVNALALGIGFLCYVGFCLFTFDTYSRKHEKTNSNILIFIYIYYTMLAYYVLNLVKGEEDFAHLQFIMQFLSFSVLCAMISYYYYSSKIKERDNDYDLNL